MMTRWISGMVLVGVVATSAACSPGANNPPPPGQTQASSTPPPATATSTPQPTGSEQLGGGAVVLPDGRHPVFFSKVDTAGRKVTFDLIVFLTGDAAEKEAKKRGQEFLNDYFVVNDNPKLRTLPINNSAKILVVNMGAPDPTHLITFSLAELGDRVNEATSKGYGSGIFWITVRGDRITLIEEQFVP
jgi:hypothetical protein